MSEKKAAYDSHLKTLREAGAIGVDYDDLGYTRTYTLTKFGESYRFTVFWNVIKCRIGKVEIIADGVSLTGAYLNQYKLNLHLLRGDKVVAVIPVEKF